MLLDLLLRRPLHLPSPQRIRIPRLEAIFLSCSGVADALCAVRLQDEHFEGAGLRAGHFGGGWRIWMDLGKGGGGLGMGDGMGRFGGK